MKTIPILLVLLLAAITVYFLLPNDEKEIRSNLDSLAESCSSQEKEPAIILLKKVALAGKLFKESCRVKIASLNINTDFTRKEVSDHILILKKRTLSTRFSFHDTAIDLYAENNAAITTTLRLEGNTGGDHFADAYELNIQAEKINGDWLFSSFTVVEFVEQ